MDIRKIKKLIELVEDSSLSELEISSGDESIRLKRLDNVTKTPKSNTKVEIANEFIVVANIAGTFYRSPSKETPAYVEDHQTIKKGDTIGLIEASTLMNNLISPYNGTVNKFLVNTGEKVEVGQAVLSLSR